MKPHCKNRIAPVIDPLGARPLANLWVAAVMPFLAFGSPPVKAGEFAVSPIRLELGATSKSGVISVRNEGKEKLSFQMQAVEWTQDTAGKDQYSDTRDLIFFPKLMTVEAGEEGLIRVGARTPVVPAEKTFRLFIEELPAPPAATSQTPSAKINVLVRFGAPIFVAPVKAEDRAEISDIGMTKGVLGLSITNTGNRHHIIQGIQLTGADAQGKEVYALTLADRYLLAGATKSFTASIAPDQCLKIAGLTIELKTDKVGITRKLDIAPAMCS